ncbi:GNAT family N-acetyltransferase [Thioclava sp. SK-1]|uniref:GNAT family N-acetyltransferase n=1 Tax=Thioclava sp. SK-1 TaxID=1889770 RepID=UPI000824365B|nr:GNAT family protein [Thioclava sp. SK-1]OCX66918.1 GNAT family N-acetyltransferase [Thioclava sp. SK-1]
MAKQFGAPLGEWTPPQAPDLERMQGRYTRLERLRPDHAHGLFSAFNGDDTLWDYMPTGPFQSETGFIRWINEQSVSLDPLFYAVIDPQTDRAVGIMSYLRIAPEIGSIELGFITLSAALQRSRAATEAFILMIGSAFTAGYRRFEWKCDSLNLPSRRAAQRLGLSYEGVFRQATHYKGRNRDTAWFAATDKDWPALQAAYAAWLDPANFDAAGQQNESLSDLTRLVRVSDDPALGA